MERDAAKTEGANVIDQRTIGGDDCGVELPQPTPEQLQFLQNICQPSADYDPTVTVGGPNRFLNETA